jgi:hypothetical protein
LYAPVLNLEINYTIVLFGANVNFNEFYNDISICLYMRYKDTYPNDKKEGGKDMPYGDPYGYGYSAPYPAYGGGYAGFNGFCGVGGAGGFWFAVVIILFVLLLIFWGWWWFSNWFY